jgi:hypothetical protein
MKQFVFGFILASAVSSWAITRHDDGSLTFDHGEVDELRLQFYQIKMVAMQCEVRAKALEEANEKLQKRLDREQS